MHSLLLQKPIHVAIPYAGVKSIPSRELVLRMRHGNGDWTSAEAEELMDTDLKTLEIKGVKYDITVVKVPITQLFRNIRESQK